MGNWADGDNIWGGAITEEDAKFYAHSCMPYGAGTAQTYSATWPNNVLYYNFVSYSSGAVSELGIRSNQAIPGADPIEVGIFEDTGTGRPGALLGSIVFDMDNKSGAISSNQWRQSAPRLVKNRQYWIGWTRVGQLVAPYVYIANPNQQGSIFGGQPSASSTGTSILMKSTGYTPELPDPAEIAGGLFHFLWYPGRLQVHITTQA